MKAIYQKKSSYTVLGAAALALSAAAASSPVQGISQGPFERVSTFYAFENSSVGSEAVAEIVAASEDGMTHLRRSARRLRARRRQYER